MKFTFLLWFAVFVLLSGCANATPTPSLTPVAPTFPLSTIPFAPVPGVPASGTPSAAQPPSPSSVPPAMPPKAVTPAKPFVIPPGGIVRDLTYCSAGSVALKMDLYYPAAMSPRMPAVVYVHGGAWRSGDKGDGEGIHDVPALVSAGYLVASVNYRLAPQYQFPAMIQDVKCAIRHLRADAAKYHLDPERIGAIGSSAGGHLVALVGLTGPSAGFDVGEFGTESSRVSAVVDEFGPVDLAAVDFTRQQMQVGQEVFGAKGPDDPILLQASPITYVTKASPPFLILQGDKDTLVHPSQSQELYDKLHAAGVPVNLVLVKNAGHSFVPSGGEINPSRTELSKMVVDFFNKHLK